MSDPAGTRRLDLSFLQQEEASQILDVLERDEQLRRADRERLSKLKSSKRDVKWLHAVSGEWFEEIQKKKFKDDTDVRNLVKPPLTHHLKKKTPKGESEPSRMTTSRNSQSPKSSSSGSSFLKIRSPFSSLFSFKKSSKPNIKLPPQPERPDIFSVSNQIPPSTEVRRKFEIYQPARSVKQIASFFEFQNRAREHEKLEKEVFQGNNHFKVTIKALSPKEFVRIHVPDPLDRNDGSFLMRYRMYGSAEGGLVIDVLYKDKPVAQSPYILEGPVYHEYCDCPEEDPDVWQQTLSCPATEAQILKDFAPFPSIDLSRMLEEVPSRFAEKRGAIVHYTVLNNQIYRRSLGKYTDFKMFSDEILQSLARKVRLPDIEFYINVGDWPVEHRKANDTPGPLPMISWCGSADSRDIILPTYDIIHSTLEALRGVTNDLLSIQGHTSPSWDNKTEQAFFRGRDSREERLQLVRMSKKYPELLDAGITGYFFFRELEKQLGKVPLIGFFDFFKYKYQVNVDGTVAAYRFPYLMLGDSLVLKQDSPYYEHFYDLLKPGKHYIPIKRDLSDLIEKIKWAKENDEEMRNIAKEGQSLARDLLQPHNLYCYYYKVFQMYAQRQTSRPEIRENMEHVPQPDDNTTICNCQRKKTERDEL